MIGRNREDFTYNFRGRQYTINTFKTNGIRIQQVAQIISEQPFITVPEIVEAIKIVNPVENYDVDADAVKRYLFMAGFRRKSLRMTNSDKNSP